MAIICKFRFRCGVDFSHDRGGGRRRNRPGYRCQTLWTSLASPRSEIWNRSRSPWAAFCIVARYRWPARSLPKRQKPRRVRTAGRCHPVVTPERHRVRWLPSSSRRRWRWWRRHRRPAGFWSICTPTSGTRWCWPSCSAARSCPGNWTAGPGTSDSGAVPSTRTASLGTPAGTSWTSSCTGSGWPWTRSNRSNRQWCTAARSPAGNTANPWHTGREAAARGTGPSTGRTRWLRPLKNQQSMR